VDTVVATIVETAVDTTKENISINYSYFKTGSFQ
jgi:hypothetical protein